jgi:hypothetical protein
MALRLNAEIIQLQPPYHGRRTPRAARGAASAVRSAIASRRCWRRLPMTRPIPRVACSASPRRCAPAKASHQVLAAASCTSWSRGGVPEIAAGIRAARRRRRALQPRDRAHCGS